MVLLIQKLNLSVWHNDPLGRNSFLGEIEIDLASWDWSNRKLNWYPLKPRVSAAQLQSCFPTQPWSLKWQKSFLATLLWILRLLVLKDWVWEQNHKVRSCPSHTKQSLSICAPALNSKAVCPAVNKSPFLVSHNSFCFRAFLLLMVWIIEEWWICLLSTSLQEA